MLECLASFFSEDSRGDVCVSVACICKCACPLHACGIMNKAFSVQEGMEVHRQVMAAKKRTGSWQAVTGSM